VDETVDGQARQVMRNLEAVLRASGMTMADVVKTTIFLVSLEDFQKVNEVYGQFFDSDPPARATIQVGALPLGALVAIEAVARR
jgi:2-iminobutanoate/2-iminopropanoate deaminase